MQEEKKIKGVHNIILENRRSLSVTGVEDVDSFDESNIVLFTEMGLLSVRGEDLHINRLSVDTGEISVEGEIHSIGYSDSDTKKSQSLISKLFK